MSFFIYFETFVKSAGQSTENELTNFCLAINCPLLLSQILFESQDSTLSKKDSLVLVNFFNNFASPLDGIFVQKGENAQVADLRK